jgi:hypothetical protein
MNIAMYNPTRGHCLLDKRSFPGLTPGEVREIALGIQLDAIQEGLDMGSNILVAWEDQPHLYLTVHALGDELSLDEDMLDCIHSLVHTRH